MPHSSVRVFGVWNLFGLSLLGLGCNVADPALLDEIDFPVGSDLCDAPDLPLLRHNDTVYVDTRNMAGNFNPRLGADGRDCGQGPDAFFRFETQPGAYWHFHIAKAPEFDTDPDHPFQVDPVLYAFPEGGCGSATCDDPLLSNSCDGDADEHFGFEVPSAGAGSGAVTYILAVDDALNEGGGVYTLSAYNPTCGNGVHEHGEFCDDPSEPGCSNDCRQLIDPAVNTAVNPNAISKREAATIETQLSAAPVQVTGLVGGLERCTYDMHISVNAPAGTVVIRDNVPNPEGGMTCLPKMTITTTGRDSLPTTSPDCETLSFQSTGTTYYIIVESEDRESTTPFNFNIALE